MSLLWIIFLALFTNCSHTENIAGGTDENDILVYEKWMEIDNALKKSINSGVKIIMPYAMDIGTKANASSTCLMQGLQLMNGIKRLETWALSFVDASGKMVDGLLSSTITSLGDYTQCLNSAATRKIDGKEIIKFRGQYCVLKIKPPLPALKKKYIKEGIEELRNYTKSASDVIRLLASKAHYFYTVSLKLGICVPSGCSIDDVNKLANYASSQVYFEARVPYCEVKSEWSPQTRNIIIISFYASLIFLMLLGTAVDLHQQVKKFNCKNKALRIAAAFSLLKNTGDLLKTETSKDTISCINGLRFLTLTWILCGHTAFYITKAPEMHQNLDEVMKASKTFGMQIIINAVFSVDTFFLIGGLVNCYICVKEKKQVCEEKKKTRNWIYSITHRLLRLLPAYAAILLLAFILPSIISGPASMAKTLERACENTWWKNFLFINNYSNFDDACLPHAWYLAAQFQLFLISCVTIRILSRYPKVGLALNFVIVFASAAFCIAWTQLRGIHATYVSTSFSTEDLDVYFRSYTQFMTHAGPYFIGVLAGYFLAKKREFEIPKVFLFFGWSLSTLMATWVVFATKKWNSGTEPTMLEDIFYSGFSKIAFSISIAWIIICCSRGYGGFINELLSWKVWTPLSRLAFCMYLVSPFVQIFSLESSGTLRDATHKEWIWRFFGDYFVSAFLAFLFFITVENPFVTIEKILYENKKRDDQKNLSQNGNKKDNNLTIEVQTITGVNTVHANYL